MFDLRYHVASLAAVFVALLLGILVGVAMSGKVDDAEKRSLQSDVNRLEAQLDAASERRANGTREQKAFQVFVRNAYPALIADRLADKRIAIVFVGPVDPAVRRDIQRTIDRKSTRLNSSHLGISYAVFCLKKKKKKIKKIYRQTKQESHTLQESYQSE